MKLTRNELEELVNCKIIDKIEKGESREKYKVLLNNNEVLLRVFQSDQSYYPDQFLREGLALRYLNKKDLNIRVPRLIDEWPKYQIRAVEWIDMQPVRNVERLEQTWKELSGLSDFKTPFSLKEDLMLHLSQSSGIHKAYIEFFEERRDIILDQIYWKGDKRLLHGDFHLMNAGYDNDRIVLYDWEYATYGVSEYDLGYLYAIHETEIPESKNDRLLPWKALATLTIAHWYLQDENFSPKDAIKWVEILDEITNQML